MIDEDIILGNRTIDMTVTDKMPNIKKVQISFCKIEILLESGFSKLG